MARRNKRRRTPRGRIRRVWALLVLMLYSALAFHAITHPILVAASLVGSILVVGSFITARFWLRRRARRRRIRTLVGLLALSPNDFELAIGDLFQSLGYARLRRVGGAGDLGVDLVGYDPDGRSVIVQCKRYGLKNRIGSPAIQGFLGMVVHHGAERGVFVTTSGYTGPAVELARAAAVPITLIDGPEISRLSAYARSL